MQPDRTPQLPPRERIVAAAHRLFSERGIARVSVDTIAARAKSTKMTLYRHFENKDALVLEWIQRVIESYSEVFDQLQRQHSESPRDQLLGSVAFIIENMRSAGYRGCPFTNILAELPEDEHPGRILIREHKKRQFKRLTRLCTLLKLSEPRHVAEELTLLMEGAQVVAQNEGIEDVGSRLDRMVRQRLEQ